MSYFSQNSANIQIYSYLCREIIKNIKTSGTSQSYIDRTKSRCGSDF